MDTYGGPLPGNRSGNNEHLYDFKDTLQRQVKPSDDR
jgi:hypothetical protein